MRGEGVASDGIGLTEFTAMKAKSNKRTAHSILWIECLGFSLIILLSWLDELLGLPHLLFGYAHRPDWHESAFESLVAASVWLVVYAMTRRVLRRFQYLEDMIMMCAWCRKVEQRDDWVSLEHYCAQELGVDLSHGICPKCGRQALGDNSAPKDSLGPVPSGKS